MHKHIKSCFPIGVTTIALALCAPMSTAFAQNDFSPAQAGSALSAQASAKTDIAVPDDAAPSLRRGDPDWIWGSGVNLPPSGSFGYNGQNIASGTNYIYQPIIAARDKLYADLQSGIQSQIGAQLVTQSGYQWHSVSISGPIDLRITPGTPVPGPTIALTGLSAAITANFKGGDWPFNWECTATIYTGTMGFSGNLDIGQGILSNLRLNTLNPNYNKSCSSGLSDIPILGQIFDNLVNQRADAALGSAISNVMTASQATFSPITFAGLNTSIPANQYVFNGFDAGQYVSNNLPTLVAQTSVLVRFYNPVKPTVPSGIDPEGGVTTVAQYPVFSINFSYPGTNLQFTAYNNTQFTSYWGCPRATIC